MALNLHSLVTRLGIEPGNEANIHLLHEIATVHTTIMISSSDNRYSLGCVNWRNAFQNSNQNIF